MPPRRTPPPNGPHESAPRRSPLTLERELVVIAEPTAQLRATRSGVASAAGVDVSSLEEALAEAGATLRPLFGASEERLRREARRPGAAGAAGGGEEIPGAPDLSVYYRVDAPDDRLDEIAAELRSHEAVRAAYVKPAAEPAAVKTPPSTSAYRPPAGAATRVAPEPAPFPPINDMAPRADEAPPATPSFVARQGYLTPAPVGIDAQFAWTQPGGSGAGVRIIDIEGEWRFGHEDLIQNAGGLVGGSQPNDPGWRNHGTAVIGEFGGDRNPFGITGICPDANVRAVSIFGGLGSAGAIRRAADLLGPGDIILIELHRPGPRATGVGQQGFIAIEWWPDDYDAIRYAVARGVIVVEAAGNGAENLDAAIYDTPGPGFPAGWSNPFRRGARDSGAILVGAGAPPPGTHGRDWGPDRSRLDFSNFGSAVDAQGWGREVTTAGYGDLQGGSNENYWYTDQFSGTSSASPIVVGALGCVQGNRRARSLAPLTPLAARNLLRTTGSAQQDAPGRPASQRIGNRPNLRQMMGVGVTLAIPLHRYWNPAATDHFYTTNWNELGAGKYGWGYEGVQCYTYGQAVPGSVPLYRYWNPVIADHFYTTNWSELGSGRYGYAYEGVQCHVFPQAASGRVPLYRYWNAAIGDHFYTTNWSELGWGRYGWGYEGVQCWVVTQAQPPQAEGDGSSLGDTVTGVPSADEPPPDGSSPIGALNGGSGSFTTGVAVATSPPETAMTPPPPMTMEPQGLGGSSFATHSSTDAFEAKAGAKGKGTRGGVTITVRVEPDEGMKGGGEVQS